MTKMCSQVCLTHSATSLRRTRVTRANLSGNLSRTQLRQTKRAAPFVVYAEPSIDIEKAVQDAEEACAGEDAEECVTAWDTVEELSAAASHKKQKEQKSVDPLDQFCEDDPDADECRTFDD